MDELLLRDPEPCDTCKSGIMKFVCFDNVRRCQTCVTKLIIQDMVIVEGPADGPPAPPSFVNKKRKKKKSGPDEDQQNLFG